MGCGASAQASANGAGGGSEQRPTYQVEKMSEKPGEELSRKQKASLDHFLSTPSAKMHLHVLDSEAALLMRLAQTWLHDVVRQGVVWGAAG